MSPRRSVRAASTQQQPQINGKLPEKGAQINPMKKRAAPSEPPTSPAPKRTRTVAPQSNGAPQRRPIKRTYSSRVQKTTKATKQKGAIKRVASAKKPTA